MNLHVTNPTENKDYGAWELKKLVKALTDPCNHERFLEVMPMLYDLHGDELEFEVMPETIQPKSS